MTRFQMLPLKSTKPVETVESERTQFSKTHDKKKWVDNCYTLITRYNLVQ